MDSTVIIVLAIVLLALIILNNIKLLPPPQPVPVGGCAGTQYGCCPDGQEPRNYRAIGKNPIKYTTGANCFGIFV